MASHPMSDILVIIPTYNERENVSDLVELVFALPEGFHILIVDDNSPDGTAGVVKALIPEYKNRLHLLERAGKLGLASAYIDGFKWALAKGYNYIFEMDCDFSHPISALPRLYRAVAFEGYDLAIGSRYTKGGKIKDWPLGRILMSYFASLYVRLVTWMPIKDTTAGFVCYHRRVLEAIDLDRINFRGYGFQIEMKYATHLLGYTIKELPITFTDRQRGTSKMSSTIFGEAFTGVLKLRLWYHQGKFPIGKPNPNRKKRNRKEAQPS